MKRMKRFKRIGRNSGGFTLVELLVAISILAVVAVLGWRGLDSIVRARIALTEQLEATRGMQLAFAQMQSDSEQMARPETVQGRPYLLAGDDRLTLVRNVFVENEPSSLQVVAYRVVDGVLTRRESLGTRDLTQLDIVWMAMISDTDSNVPVPLQSNVGTMRVLTWENNSWQMSGQQQQQQLQQQQQQQQQQPQMPQQLQNAVNQAARGPTGLQVALQITGMAAPMVKSFLLGGL